MVYGSCPVELAAHQMLNFFSAARLASNSGSTVFLQRFEWSSIAKEAGFIRRHRIDNIPLHTCDALL